jgi:Na+/melibiose symporter-like transporter
MSKIRTPRAVAAGPRASYRSVLAVGEFRVLLAGLLMYGLGFEFEILGLSVLVYARTGSGLLAAVAFSAGFAPQAVAGAFFTSLADRLPPRAVISGGLLARAAPGLVIGLASEMPVPLTLTVAAAAALVTPVFLAGSSGLLPEILDGDRYTLGRSLVVTVSGGTQIAALGLGGALLSVLPARWLLIFAGALLAASALVTRLGLRSRPARASAGDGAGSRNADGVDGRARGTVRATLAGNRELLATPGLRRLLLMQWLPTWFATGAEALVVPYTVSVGHPASAASLLLAAGPCGMLAGNVVVGRLCAPAVRERLVLPLAVLLGVPLLAFAWRPPLAIAALALLVSGVGLAYTLGLQRAFADTVPPHLRGQGFGLASTGLMGGQGLLPSALGGVATALGASGAMAVAGAGVVAGALLTRRPPPRQAGASGARSPGHSLPMSGPGRLKRMCSLGLALRLAGCCVQTSWVVDGDA